MTRPMTVGDLRDKLEEFPDYYPVWAGGSAGDAIEDVRQVMTADAQTGVLLEVDLPRGDDSWEG